MQIQHKELIHSFREVLSVEAALRQQIITAVDSKYSAALHNRNTKSIKKTIDVIIKYLFYTYGKFAPQMLIHREDVFK